MDRLYKLIEDGLAKMDDVLRGRITNLKLDHDRAKAALERARTAVRPEVHISPAVLERFGATMRGNLTTGAVPFRKAVITSFVDRIEVDDHEIRIMGDKGTLERAVLGNSGSSGAEPAGVRSLVRNWRREWDSNPRWTCAHASFQDWCLKPLGHLSSMPAARSRGMRACHVSLA